MKVHRAKGHALRVRVRDRVQDRVRVRDRNRVKDRVRVRVRVRRVGVGDIGVSSLLFGISEGSLVKRTSNDVE